jgi:hypothetical protein
MSDHNHSTKLLEILHRRLQILREQRARLGRNTSPEVEIEIEDIEVEIKQLEAEVEEKALFVRFWRIHDEEPLYCAISVAGFKDIGPYTRLMTGFGEIRGYASIIYSLTRAYENSVMKDVDLYFGDDTFPRHNLLEGSMILLGGDDVNKVTDRVKKEFDEKSIELPFHFHYEGKGEKQLIVLDKNGKKTPFKPEYNYDKEGNYKGIKYDYGVVARLPNPFRPIRKIYLFAGCHTYGTAAAAKVVAVSHILEEIEATYPGYKSSKYFVLIIRCRVMRDNTLFIDDKVFHSLNEKLFKPILSTKDLSSDNHI